MTRTQSARTTWRTPNPSRIGLSIYTPAGRSSAVIEMASLFLVLGWATACAGASGPGIGIKVGAQTLEDPMDLDKTTRARLEVEVSSPLLFDEHLDFALAFGGSSLGSYTETYTDTVDGTFIDDLYTDRLWLLDVRLAARLYPLGGRSRLRPYVGAGVAYVQYKETNSIGTIEKGALGLIGRAGLLVMLGPSFCIDLQGTWSTCSVQPLEVKANLGGFSFGLGLGFEF